MSRHVEPETDDLTALLVDAPMDAIDGVASLPVKTDPNDTPEDVAARAVYAALVADTGRPKAIWRSKEVAKESLGVKALWTKRWDKVLASGKAQGLFEIDSSRKYNVLKALPQPELEPEPKAKPRKPKAKPDPDKSYTPPPRPDDWKPTGYLECGHWEVQMVRPDIDENGHMAAAKMTRVDSPDECLLCKKGVAGHPQHMTGKYVKPLLERMWRTLEREASPGFPGYCVDKKGFYIGGIGNDCRHYRPKKTKPCVVHKPRPRRKKGEGL